MSSKPKVTGIGGVFFKCQDPQKLKSWYGEYLGLPVDEFGAMFSFRDADAPDKQGHLQWSPFEKDTTYFAPSEKPFMINYRVNDLLGLLALLKEKGVEPLGPMEVYDYGKFAHILDPEGNKIELWEPIDEVFETPDKPA